MRYLNAGESHGKALVTIIEGLPSNLEIDKNFIDSMLSLRQGGYGRGGRMMIERDEIDIFSGVRGGLTSGAPLSFLIWNKDWKNWEKIMDWSKDADLESRKVTQARPGHADYTGALKYQQDDIRNVLERASARETASRVAIGAIAMSFLKEFGIEISFCVINIAGLACPQEIKDIPADIFLDPLYCPCPETSAKMVARIDQAQKEGESLGGLVQVIVKGLPPGIGSYVNPDRKLDSKIAGAIMGIQAFKGVEIGLGFEVANKPGSQVHDEIFYEKERGVYRETNRAGGIEGGMSNGQDLIIKAAMKPIPTLYKPLRSIDIHSGEAYEAAIERSDTCAVPAASVVAASVTAWVIAQAFTEKFTGDSMEEIKESFANWQKRVKSFTGGQDGEA